jgi:hypothetical protein
MDSRVMPQFNMLVPSERKESSKDAHVQRKSNEVQEDSYLQDQERSLSGNLPCKSLMLDLKSRARRKPIF